MGQQTQMHNHDTKETQSKRK